MWQSAKKTVWPSSTGTQLPVDTYFDEALLKREQDEIFNKWPRYAGHSLLVPVIDDYCVLPHHDNGLTLVHGDQGIQLLSNVCRHRQATILQGRGNSKRLSCPMHRWTYNNSGVLVTAPKFAELPCVQECGGVLPYPSGQVIWKPGLKAEGSCAPNLVDGWT